MKKDQKDDPWDHIQHDEGGEEGWIVSYADMVTLLFGFFVILYSFSTVDDKKFDKMAEELATTFKSNEKNQDTLVQIRGAQDSKEEREIRALHMLFTMMNLEKSSEENVQAVERAFRNNDDKEAISGLLDRVKDQVVAAGVVKGVETTEDTINLLIPSESLFEAGNAEITAKAITELQKIAGDLRGIPDISKIEITGHTDGAPIKADKLSKNNFTLSSERAGAVAAALIRFGVDEKILVVRGVAHLEPLVPEKDSSGRVIPENMAKNRRVQIVVKRKAS